jgi:hypothetical protein
MLLLFFLFSPLRKTLLHKAAFLKEMTIIQGCVIYYSGSHLVIRPSTSSVGGKEQFHICWEFTCLPLSSPLVRMMCCIQPNHTCHRWFTLSLLVIPCSQGSQRETWPDRILQRRLFAPPSIKIMGVTVNLSKYFSGKRYNDSYPILKEVRSLEKLYFKTL